MGIDGQPSIVERSAPAHTTGLSMRNEEYSLPGIQMPAHPFRQMRRLRLWGRYDAQDPIILRGRLAAAIAIARSEIEISVRTHDHLANSPELA